MATGLEDKLLTGSENIWKLHNGKGKSKKNTHPAQMPFDLARDHIITWSNPNVLLQADAGT